MSLTNQGFYELLHKELNAQSKSLGFRPARKLFPIEESLNCVMGLSPSQRKLIYPPNTPSEVSSARAMTEQSRNSKAAVAPYFYDALPGLDHSTVTSARRSSCDEVFPDDSASNVCPASSVGFAWHINKRPF